jgi:hypothetical protein
VLLYDSTYYESGPPFDEKYKRHFGYSSDRGSDCVQVVIPLVVMLDDLPLAYEMMVKKHTRQTSHRASA